MTCFLGSLLLIIASPLFFRTGHIALCSHFLILWSIYLVIRALDDNRRYPTVGFRILLALACAIHADLLAMVLPLAAALAACLGLRPSRVPVWRLCSLKQ